MSFLPPKNYFQISFHPLFALLFTYMTGLIAGLYWHPPAIIIFVIACSFLVFGVYFLVKKYSRISNLAYSLGLFLAGILSINHYLRPEFPSHHIYCWAQNRPLTIEGCLYRPAEYLSEKTRLYARAQWVWASNKKIPVTGNVLLTIENNGEPFLLSDRIIFSTRLRKPRNFGNPGGFDYVRWIAFQDIYVTGYVSKDQTIVRIGEPENKSWLRKIDEFRSKIRKTIDLYTPPPANLFLRAMVLGERGVIPDEINESFTRTGTAHIIAISGLNIGIVAAFFYFLFKRLLSLSEYLLLITNVPKLSASLTLLPIFLYSLIAGAGVSVQRAFIMAAAYIVALIFNRERDLYHTLALAALVILVIQPPALFGASFQLSFVSVLGIVFFTPRIISLLPIKDALLQKTEHPLWRNAKQKLILFVAVSFSAMLATGPLVAYHFSLVSLSSILANLIIVPLAGFLVVVLSLFGVLLISFSSFLAGLLFQISGFLSDIAIGVTTFLANLPWTSFLIPTPTLIGVFLFYLFLLSLFFWKFYGWPKKFIIFSFILLVINTGCWHFHFKSRGFQVTFIDVGQGDSALLRFPGDKTMLIDGGGFPRRDFDTGKNIISPFLLRQGIRKIDYLVLTHPHPDHYDGLRYIAKNFPIHESWTNGDKARDPFFWELEKTLVKKKVLIRTLTSETPGKTIQGVKVDIIHPPPYYLPDQGMDACLNNRSLVIKFSYGDISFLFTGDILLAAEEKLLSRGTGLGADVLKIPHHGSLTSSSISFLKSVSPRIAVCSVGFHNPFNLPHRQTIGHFKKKGCETFRTDLNGAIVITTDGKKVGIKCCGKNPEPRNF